MGYEDTFDIQVLGFTDDLIYLLGVGCLYPVKMSLSYRHAFYIVRLTRIHRIIYRGLQ